MKKIDYDAIENGKAYAFYKKKEVIVFSVYRICRHKDTLMILLGYDILKCSSASIRLKTPYNNQSDSRSLRVISADHCVWELSDEEMLLEVAGII
jgi:hypothetical protein